MDAFFALILLFSITEKFSLSSFSKHTGTFEIVMFLVCTEVSFFLKACYVHIFVMLFLIVAR